MGISPSDDDDASSEYLGYVHGVLEHEVAQCPECVEGVSVVVCAVPEPVGGKAVGVGNRSALRSGLQVGVPVGDVLRLGLQTLDVPARKRKGGALV